jgi:membrane protein CcdC involved in cytochrome C biogenesis
VCESQDESQDRRRLQKVKDLQLFTKTNFFKYVYVYFFKATSRVFEAVNIFFIFTFLNAETSQSRSRRTGLQQIQTRANRLYGLQSMVDQSRAPSG